MTVLNAAPVLTDSIKPRVVGLVPAAVVTGLPADIGAASEMLGLRPEQLVDHGDGTLQADLDVPGGIWRVWPGAGSALWVSARGAASPPLPAGVALEPIDLAAAVANLHAAGHWVSELRVLSGDEWSPPLRVRAALEVLTDPRATISGISAYWSDSPGAARVEIFTNGHLWADDSLRAERFILVAKGLES